jgi:hypothetical protein
MSTYFFTFICDAAADCATNFFYCHHHLTSHYVIYQMASLKSPGRSLDDEDEEEGYERDMWGEERRETRKKSLSDADKLVLNEVRARAFSRHVNPLYSPK